MALPNRVLAGFQASFWCQTGSNPVAFTPEQLSIWTAEIETLVGTVAGGTGMDGEQLLVEAVPAFGQADGVVSFGVAGSRQSDQIPIQSKPTSLTIVSAWNPSDAGTLLMRSDAYSGTIDRTFVVALADGDNTVCYAFNGRVSEFQIDTMPNAEAKCTFTVHPRGNQYGWSNNT